MQLSQFNNDFATLSPDIYCEYIAFPLSRICPLSLSPPDAFRFLAADFPDHKKESSFPTPDASSRVPNAPSPNSNF
jgi:hypothetical protein